MSGAGVVFLVCSDVVLVKDGLEWSGLACCVS